MTTHEAENEELKKLWKLLATSQQKILRDPALEGLFEGVKNVSHPFLSLPFPILNPNRGLIPALLPSISPRPKQISITVPHQRNEIIVHSAR